MDGEKRGTIMKKIGILAAMEVELDYLKTVMTGLKENSYSSFTFYEGSFNDVEVVLCVCGVGKVNAAACTQLIIDKFNVTHIINTGIAGSLNSSVKPLDIVVSDYVTYHDVRVRQMRELFPYVTEFKADEMLIHAVERAFVVNGYSDINIHRGKIVTGEAFVDNAKLKQRIVEGYNPLCVEMEGGAIAHVSYINKVPFVIVRSISDNADDEARGMYDDFEAISSKHSAELVEMVMKELSDPEYIDIDENLRLKRYTGTCNFALEWYQDEDMVKLVDGPDAVKYTMNKLQRMYNVLDRRGELYFIEAKENNNFIPIGDVTLCSDDMPIVIGNTDYRSKGIGMKVINALLERGQDIGYKIFGVKEIYDYNLPSQKCFEKAGFSKHKQTEKGYSYVLQMK